MHNGRRINPSDLRVVKKKINQSIGERETGRGRKETIKKKINAPTTCDFANTSPREREPETATANRRTEKEEAERERESMNIQKKKEKSFAHPPRAP